MDTKIDVNNCLCYTEEKGLFQERCADCSEAIFKAHDYKGYKTQSFEVPEKKFSVTIKSNFHFGSRSYLAAFVEMNGLRILDFSLNKLTVLNSATVGAITVEPGNWCALMTKIVEAYYHSMPVRYIGSAVDYIDGLTAMLDQDSITIRSSLGGAKHCWDGNFPLLFAADKIRDLLKWIKEAQIDNDALKHHVLALCIRFMDNLKKVNLKDDEPQFIRLADTLCDVAHYMVEHEAGWKLIECFKGKT